MSIFMAKENWWQSTYPGIYTLLIHLNQGDVHGFPLPNDSKLLSMLESMLLAQPLVLLLQYANSDEDEVVSPQFEPIHRLVVELELLNPGRQG